MAKKKLELKKSKMSRKELLARLMEHRAIRVASKVSDSEDVTKDV